MADTSNATIAAVVERLKPSWAQDEEVTYAIAGSADDALRKIANGYIVSANGIRSESASLISALEAERDRLRAELAKAASALLAAEKRVREECARLGEEGYDRPVGTPYRSDGVRSKYDQCPHNRYQYEDCERCYAAAIRKGGEHA